MTEAQTIEAIFEDGVFRPLETPVGLPEHMRVKITIEPQMTEDRPFLQFVGILSDEEAVELERVIAEEFSKVDVDAW